MMGRPLTNNQRNELLAVYEAKGFRAAKPLAIKFGIAPRYISRLALMHGITNNRARNAGCSVPRSTHQDPRWAWAIERGIVVA